VINGSATQGTLYVHNYGSSAASGVSFDLGSATTKTKVKTALAKVGLNLGGYEDANGFVLINPERCASIPAGGSCAVNFTTPSMSVGNLGNSLVKLAYKGSNGSATTSQVVNYKYVNLAALSGVNFTGSLNITGVQGSTQHVVGYVYAGGASGTSYKNVNLNSTNATTRISNGFISGQEVVAGQVIAVEFAVAMQSNKTSSVNVTPSWGSSQLHASLQTGANSGSPLTLSLTPAQNTVNLIFGNIPVLSAPTTSPAVVNVVNNGNADSSGGLTATATGGNASDLTITNNCGSTVLAANAANSCQITFSTASYTSGTTTVEYKDNTGAVVGSQTVVWSNSKPFPAVYLAPSPSTISFGKGTSTGANSIVFTVTNVGQAPLENVTYPVTNTGSASWTEDVSTCTSSIGASASCTISGHLTGTNDGAGNLYIKAVGSFNSVNYSFAALPLAYTVTAAPSLQITPVSANMTLLANGVESQSQTYTVTNIGNDPALFTGLSLTDSSTHALKPVISGGDCTSSTTLNETNSCTVVVKYGPAAASQVINESGVATLQVAYHGGTPDTNYNSQATLNYNLVGNDSYVTESTTTTNLPGAGTSGSPYAGNANLDPMKITLTYGNPSSNYPMSNFNLNTNNLPYGLVVDPSSTCTTGSATMSLESNGGSCTLVLALDRSLLTTAGGSVVLDFTTPTATWSTPLGFYSQAGTQTYLTYAQPSVVFALSNNNASFESTVLSITGSNLDKGANPLPVSVSGVNKWLESSPVNPSAGCTVNASTYAVSCNLTAGTNPANVTYLMPNYLQAGESANIPLIFSSIAYAYLNPSYTFINYLAPEVASAIITQATSITFSGNYAFLTSNVSSQITQCLVDDNGVLSACSNIDLGSGLLSNGALNISIAANDSGASVATILGNGATDGASPVVVTCPVNGDGTLGIPCSSATITPPPSGLNVSQRTSLATNLTTTALSSASDLITSYSIKVKAGVVMAGVIDQTAHSIRVTVPYGVSLNGLVASFTVNGNTTVKVNNVTQVSGVTANDFSSGLLYAVTPSGGSTVYYSVSVQNSTFAASALNTKNWTETILFSFMPWFVTEQPFNPSAAYGYYKESAPFNMMGLSSIAYTPLGNGGAAPLYTLTNIESSLTYSCDMRNITNIDITKCVNTNYINNPSSVAFMGAAMYSTIFYVASYSDNKVIPCASDGTSTTRCGTTYTSLPEISSVGLNYPRGMSYKANTGLLTIVNDGDNSYVSCKFGSSNGTTVTCTKHYFKDL
jgi:hypothetical protein